MEKDYFDDGSSEFPLERSFLDDELNPHYDQELAARAVDDVHHGLLVEEALARKNLIRESQSNLADEEDYIAAQKRLEDARDSLSAYEADRFGPQPS